MNAINGWLLLFAAAAAQPVAAQRQALAPAPKPNYEVSGQLTDARAGTRLYLTDDESGQPVPLDSAVTDAAGRFRLRGVVAAPGVYSLRVSGQQQTVGLALAPGCRLQVRANAFRLGNTSEVHGSAEAEALAEMNRTHARIAGLLEALHARRTAITDADTLVRIDQQMAACFGAFTAAAQRVARQPSYLAPYATAAFLSGAGADEAFLDSATTRYARQWPASPYTRRLLHYQAMRRATAVGQPAPDIRLLDPDGRPVALSSLRGQVVLVDFWASWCGPCREENPRLRKLYQQYHAQGFTVYGVSVDRKKEDWLKAIRQDGLTWPQVQDAPGPASVAGSVYNVYEYPTSFLLDPQGCIVAKNLRGEALEQKVAAMLR
ncbi:TlpA disulfide reductase family protein [Hymenobacter coalescens]